MSPFVAAAAKALQEQPAVNAVIDDGHIVYRDYGEPLHELREGVSQGCIQLGSS